MGMQAQLSIPVPPTLVVSVHAKNSTVRTGKDFRVVKCSEIEADGEIRQELSIN